MPKKRPVRWAEQLKAILPKQGSIAHSLFKAAGVAGLLVLMKMDEVWCSIIPPNRHKSD